MNSGMKVGLGRPVSDSRALCVSPYYIQNIRNIKETEEKHQQKQSLTAENLLRPMENKQKQTGTNSGTQVLEVFRNPTFPANRCSPCGMRAVAESPKNTIRNVPHAPEHFRRAASHGIRGIQQCAWGPVPDVLDIPRACAWFWFFAPFCGPTRYPPWPN